jgi:hypothetical protein
VGFKEGNRWALRAASSYLSKQGPSLPTASSNSNRSGFARRRNRTKPSGSSGAGATDGLEDAHLATPQGIVIKAAVGAAGVERRVPEVGVEDDENGSCSSLKARQEPPQRATPFHGRAGCLLTQARALRDLYQAISFS